MIFKVDTHKDWETYGKTAPYFGVLSNAAFGEAEISEADKAAFFATGEKHVEKLLRTLGEVFDHVPAGTAMDFGCGVGRITLALAGRYERVIGFDVSPSMVEVARSVSGDRGRANVEYVCTESGFEPGLDQFDLVHSYLVLQHVPVREGMAIITRMLASLRVGGVGAIHFTSGQAHGAAAGRLKRIVKEYAPLRAAYNLLTGRAPSAPRMQMNPYPLQDVLRLIAQAGIERVFVDIVDDWGDLGYFVFFQKGEKAKSLWANPRRSV